MNDVIGEVLKNSQIFASGAEFLVSGSLIYDSDAPKRHLQLVVSGINPFQFYGHRRVDVA